MPRRKNPVEPTDAPDQNAEPSAAASEKPKRVRKVLAAQADPSPQVAPQPASQPAPEPIVGAKARTRRLKQAAEPTPATSTAGLLEAKPRRARHAAEALPELAPVAEESVKPRARRTRKDDAPASDQAPATPSPEEPMPRSRRAKQVVTPLVQVESGQTVAAPPNDPSATKAPRRSRTRRRKDRRDREITAEAALTPPEDDGGSPTSRRSRREVALHLDFDVSQPTPAATQADEAEDMEEDGSRRRRRGHGGRRSKSSTLGPLHGGPEDGEATEQLPSVATAQLAETLAAPVTRHLVLIPEGAPQVVLRDGVPTLTRGRRVLPPLMFFGASTDERQAENVLAQIRLAADAGVHVFSHLIELVVDPESVNDSVAMAGYLLNKTVQVDAAAQVLFRVVFAAPRGWEDRYRKAAYVAESGGLAEPSVCDDDFWGVAERCLADFSRKMRLLDNRDHILGLHLERGEWFFAEGWGYDVSIAAHEKFRDWLRTRYRDDIVALRAAWFDGQAQFQTVGVPEYDPDVRVGEEFVRTGRKARRWVDYHLFLSDVTVERVARLAYAAKQSSDGWFLVGASYGYTFEWSHPASGHLSLGKLLRTPEIDFIAGPPSYKNRDPGGTAPFPGPIDSFALNGKLYISEEDFKTPISGVQEPDDFNPVMKTPQALESVHWRGAGAAISHASGVCWMDLWGNGWLATSGIWERGARVRDALIARMGSPIAEPDVAVFIDERSLAYLVDIKAFALLVQNVREAVLRSGMSAGFYLLSDLAHRERFPESKLYVFMNAWDMRPEVRGAIKNRLQRDGKLLFWLYAAGLFEAGRDSLERVREVTGIALKPQPFAMKPGSAIRHRRHPLCEPLPEKTLSTGGNLEPSYFAIPEDGLVLGEYAQSGLPSYVAREFHVDDSPTLHWKSVFLGEPVVTPGLFRALGQAAGAHIWNYHEDVTHVRPPFLTVHCSGAGSRTIALPDRWSAYSLTHGQWAATDSTHLRFNATDGSTHVFVVGLQSEIEPMLAREPAELLTLEQAPERRENTLELDALSFDVQIMKLDEFMEDAWSEEVAEDLFLKPSQLQLEELEAGAPEDAPRKKRRRGGKSRTDRPKERDEAPPAGTRRPKPKGTGELDDLGMNVLFRKRE